MSATEAKENPVVFFDVSIGNVAQGRLKFELFADIVPRYELHHVSCSKI
jgi:peptidyl-prolyl isomerase H (cyclophilin H)